MTLVATVLRLLGRRPRRQVAWPDFFCVCREPECYCDAIVPVNGWSCPDCAFGRHVWTLAGPREERHR